MTAACVDPLPLYRPRDPRASDLWQLLDQHFETFQQVYDERFAAKYGFWRPVVEHSREGLPQVRRSAAGLRPRPLPGLPPALVLGQLSVVRCSLSPLQLTNDH